MKNTITILLDKLGVSYTPFYLSKLTEKCNSAQTLSDVKLLLAYYKIDSLAVQIGKEELAEIPLPALVLSSQKDENGRTQNEYSVLEEVTEKEVVLITPKGEKETIKLDKFVSSWTGYTLLLDANETSQEPNYSVHRKAEAKQRFFDGIKTTIQVLVAILFLFLVGKSVVETNQENAKSVIQISFYILHVIGFVMSAILLSGEIFKNNVVFKKACQAFGKSSCNVAASFQAVANKSQFDINPIKRYFTFSELGVYYFFGVLLFLLINHTHSLGLVFQSMVSALGVFAVGLSLYYQKFVLKKWCSLCVSVMVVLFLESVLGITYLFSFTSFENTDYSFYSFVSIAVMAAFSFLLPVFIWNILKPIFTKYNSLKTESKNLHSFKYDFEVFKTLLSQSRKIDVREVPTHFVEGKSDLNQNEEEEREENENKVSLVVISRPTCPPCMSAKKDLQKLRENFGNYFTTTTVHLAANQMGEDYKQISELLSNLPISYSDLEEENIISEHYAWISQTEVDFTPAFIVNGHLLPSNYTVLDLEYFLIHLASEMEEMEENEIGQEQELVLSL